MTMLGHREVIGLVVIVGLASGVVVEAVAMEAPSVKDDADDEDSEGIESAVHLLRRSREKWPMVFRVLGEVILAPIAVKLYDYLAAS
mmetsp:Transcript_8316/g.16922  ORF Transcript_8316/g.16922 Transcript_8316/m.16922 type:complete len:87 (-) Transcript_8316:682-942(-)